jgi:hypothetical protein
MVTFFHIDYNGDASNQIFVQESKETGYRYHTFKEKAEFWIRIGFNADPDQGI